MAARQQQLQRQQQLAQQLQHQQSAGGAPPRQAPLAQKPKPEVPGLSVQPAKPPVQHAQKLMQVDREEHPGYVQSGRQQFASQEQGSVNGAQHPQHMARSGVPPQQTMHVAAARGAEPFQRQRQPQQPQQVLVRQQATTHSQTVGESSAAHQGIFQESRSPHLSGHPMPQQACPVQQQNHLVSQQAPMAHQVQPVMLQRQQHYLQQQPQHVHPGGGPITAPQQGYPSTHQHGQIPMLSGQQPPAVPAPHSHHGQPAQQLIPPQHAPTQQHQQLNIAAALQQAQQRPVPGIEFQQNVVARGQAVAAAGVQSQTPVHQLPQPQRQQVNGHEQALLAGHHREAPQIETRVRQFGSGPFTEPMPPHTHRGHGLQQGSVQQGAVQQEAGQAVFGTQQPPRQPRTQQPAHTHPMQHAVPQQQQLGYRQPHDLGQQGRPQEHHSVASQQQQGAQQTPQHSLQYHQYQHDIPPHQQLGYSSIPVRAQGSAPVEQQQQQLPSAGLQAAAAHMWPGSGGAAVQVHHNAGQVYPGQAVAAGQAAPHQSVGAHQPQHHPGHGQQVHVQQQPQYMQQQGGGPRCAPRICSA